MPTLRVKQPIRGEELLEFFGLIFQGTPVGYFSHTGRGGEPPGEQDPGNLRNFGYFSDTARGISDTGRGETRSTGYKVRKRHLELFENMVFTLRFSL